MGSMQERKTKFAFDYPARCFQKTFSTASECSRSCNVLVAKDHFPHQRSIGGSAYRTALEVFVLQYKRCASLEGAPYHPHPTGATV